MPSPTPPRAALSTMWAVQPRFEADIASFLTAAAEAGFAGIEVNHSMDPRQTATLIEAARATGLEARSLHAPAPWTLIEGGPPDTAHLRGRENRTLNLASLDEAERRLAVAHHITSIELAARASMTAVVVHLGGIGILDATLAEEDWLRAAYLKAASSRLVPESARPEPVEGPPRADSSERPPSTVPPRPVEPPRMPPSASDVGARGLAPPVTPTDRGAPANPPKPGSASQSAHPELMVSLSNHEGRSRADREAARPPTTEAWLAHLDAAHRARAAIAAPWLEAARRSLAQLAPRAAEAGLTLGLETRLRYNEFPLPEEAADLLREHPPEVVGYWHDVGHAEVLARIGLVPLQAWRTLLTTRLVGVHIHDVAGLTDHRAPGNAGPQGVGVDFAALARMLPSTALRTFEVDQHEPPAALASGLALARTAGVVG